MPGDLALPAFSTGRAAQTSTHFRLLLFLHFLPGISRISAEKICAQMEVLLHFQFSPGSGCYSNFHSLSPDFAFLHLKSHPTPAQSHVRGFLCTGFLPISPASVQDRFSMPAPVNDEHLHGLLS